MINEIKVSQLGINDQEAKVINKYFNNYDLVKKENLLCELETSKAVISIHSEFEGYIFWLVKDDENVNIQTVIAVISDNKNEINKYLDNIQSKITDERKITKKALALLNQYNIKIDDLNINAGNTIREIDIISFIEKNLNIKNKEIKPAFMSKIAVLNATGGGLSVVETALEANINVVCLIDDIISKNKSNIFGIPVVNYTDFLLNYKDKVEGVYIHLQKNRKQEVEKRFKEHYKNSPTIIHPKAFVAKSVKIGEGVLVKAGAVIDTECNIYDNSIIDNGAIIPHHCNIGEYSHISPGVSMGGFVKIEDNVVIGIGAKISPEITIKKGSIVLPGAVIRKDVAEYSIMDGIDNKIGDAKKIS